MRSIMKNINHSLEQNLIVIVILNQMQWRIESMHVKQETGYDSNQRQHSA
jgi:hypothetical protein